MRGKRFHRLTFVSALALAAGVAAVVTSSAGARTSYAFTCDNQDNNGATQSVTITQPITCNGATYGVLIGAPGVTVKCTGAGAINDNVGGTYGVYNPGYDHVSVIGCPISGFDYGIDAFGFSTPDQVNGQVFKGNTITFGDEYGIFCEFCHGTQILNNTINATTADTTGIYLEGGSFNKVDPTVVNMGGLSDTYGVYLYEENGDLVKQTTVNQAYSAGFTDDWINACFDQTTGNTFQLDISNGVNDETYGFEVYETVATTFLSNFASSGYIGFWTSHGGEYCHVPGPAKSAVPSGHPSVPAKGSPGVAAPTSIAGDGIVVMKANAAANNADDGFELNYDNAGSAGSVFSGNHSHHNGNIGFEAYGPADSMWNGNDSSYNNESGYFLEFPWEATMTNNTARFNNDSSFPVIPAGGFELDTDGYMLHLFSHNSALNNNGWAMYSEDGFVPGGGNRAIGNSFGCFNVTCT